MDLKHPMEKTYIDDIPQPEAEQRAACNGARAVMAQSRSSSPQQPEANHHYGVHQDVEYAVSEDLVCHVAKPLILYQAEQMMPLKNLVQQYAVEEAAQADSDDQRRGDEAACRGRGWLTQVVTASSVAGFRAYLAARPWALRGKDRL